MVDPYEHLREGHSGGCGITDEVSQWMEKVQNSAMEDEEVPTPSPKFKKHKAVGVNNALNYEEPVNKYTKEANEYSGRHKRATKREEIKNTCSLYIQTDPLIWRHIREGFPEVMLNIKKEKLIKCRILFTFCFNSTWT